MAIAAGPLRLRLDAWDQVETLLARQIRRGAVILRAERPPPIGSPLTVALELPTGQTIELTGWVDSHLAADASGRLGVRLALRALEPEALFAMESGIAKSRRRTAPGRLGGTAAPSGAPGELVVEGTGPPPIEADGFDPLPTDVGQAPLGDVLVAGLRAELAQMRTLDPFALLGLRIDPTDVEVKDAFTHRSRRYHPSQLARYEVDAARVLAGEVYLLLRDAYRQLAHAGARETTHAALRTGRGARPRAVDGGHDPASTPTVVPVNAARAIAPPSMATPPPMVGRATPPAGVRALAATPTTRLTPALGNRALVPDAVEESRNERQAAALQPERVLSFRATGSSPVLPVEVPLSSPPMFGVPIANAHDTTPGFPPPRFEPQRDESELTMTDGPPPDELEDQAGGIPEEVSYEISTPMNDVASSAPSNELDAAASLNEIDAAAAEADDQQARERLRAAIADAEADRWDQAELTIEALAQAYPHSRDVRAAREAIVGHRRLAAGERGLAVRHFEAAVAAAPGLGLARRGLEAARRAAPATRAVVARLKPRSRT